MHDDDMLEEAEVMLPPTRVEVVDVEWRDCCIAHTGAGVSVVVAAVVVVVVVVVAIVASCEFAAVLSSPLTVLPTPPAL